MSDIAKIPQSKWTRWVLIASLGLNLVVAGLGLGAFIHGGPGRAGDMLDLGFGPFDNSLRPEDRDAVKAAMRAKSGALSAARAAMVADSVAVLAALRTNPFDATALRTALASQEDHLNARLKLGTDTIGDYLAALTEKDRLEFADRLEHHLRHGKEPAAASPEK